jgi:hypothetical protein
MQTFKRKEKELQLRPLKIKKDVQKVFEYNSL